MPDCEPFGDEPPLEPRPITLPLSLPLGLPFFFPFLLPSSLPFLSPFLSPFSLPTGEPEEPVDVDGIEGAELPGMPGIDEELPPGIELGDEVGAGVEGIDDPPPPGKPPLGGAGVPAVPPLDESLPQPLTSNAPLMAITTSEARRARALNSTVVIS